MKKDRDAYIVLAPLGKSKIYSVAARRVGSRDRYSVVATCTSDTVAQQIVDGLKLLQGEVVAIETVTQRTLANVRSQYTVEHGYLQDARNKLRDAEIRHREEMREADRKIRDAIREHDAAQKNAREQA